MRRFFLVSIIAVSAWAQLLPTHPDSFYIAFKERLQKYSNFSAVQRFLEEFSFAWDGGVILNSEKQRLAQEVNNWLKKKTPLYPNIMNYVHAFLKIKATDAHLRVPPQDFFKVTKQLADKIDRLRKQLRQSRNQYYGTQKIQAQIAKAQQDFNSYLQHLVAIVPRGIVQPSTQFQWFFSQKEVRLEMKTMEKEEVPVLYFSNTDLYYIDKSGDSVKIRNVKGYLDLVKNHLYVEKARYDWSRLGIPPEEIYVDLANFKINLNNRNFQCDSAVLHYESLIGKPLKGKFIEHILPSGSPAAAQYPQFIGTEGGVVIENLIPNVSYRGSFAMRGLKKYGSKYLERVYVPPEVEEKPKEEEPPPQTEEDEWGYEDDYEYEDYGDYEEEYYEEEEYEEDYDPRADPANYQLVERLAELTIFNKTNRKVLRLQADEFALDPKELKMDNAKVTIFLEGGDSIYHPKMNLSYNVKTQDIVLIKPKSSRQPFVSSYHKFYLYFETLKWNPNENDIRFTSLIDVEHKRAALESFDFFVQYRFNQFRGILRFNPIGILYRYIKEHPENRNFIYDSEVLKAYKLERYLGAFQHALKDLELSGFIEYDRVSGRITPLPKLYKWALAALKKKDYDAIQIVSVIKGGDYGRLDYESKNLYLNGVLPFYFSDSQQVKVFPEKAKLIVGQNRSLDFGGVILAGKINLYAHGTKKYHFDYVEFKVYCDSIDSLKFFPERDPYFNPKRNPKLTQALKRLKLEGLTGALYIDKPNNKSGKKPFHEYPVFDCYSYAYVYWRDSSIQGGVYTPDVINFQVDPFVLDSLETFDLSRFELKGKFNCEPIMPSFRDTLKPVADGTYGIHEKLPEEGVPLYEGKGRFYNEITMDSYGFHGNGTLTFLSTTAESDTFLFHPDSVMATTRKFSVKAGTYGSASFPDIEAERLKYKWYPYKERLIVETIDAPMRLYGGEALFMGRMEITPEGIVADGTIQLNEVIVKGSHITFKEKDFDASIATFAIADTADTTKKYFVAYKHNVHYDVRNHNATFVTTTPGKANTYLPQQQYRTTLGQGNYNRQFQKIVLNAHKAYQNENYIESTDKQKHGLKFMTNTAVIDLKLKQVSLTGVDSLLVADAVIYPAQGQLEIAPDGHIPTLHNAKIAIPPGKHWHTIVNAEVSVESGISYKASGRYPYIVINGDTQYIHFESIAVRSDTTTYAIAQINEEDNFLITERIFFRDQVELLGKRRFLRFDGEVKIQSSNPFFRKTWFTFADVVNPDSIFIPVKNPKNKAGEQLTVGVHYIPMRRRYYCNFLMPRKDKKGDKDVLLAEGGLTFDRALKAFRIGPRERLEQKRLRGNVVTYNDSTYVISAEGYFHIPFNIHPDIATLEVSGRFVEEQKDYKQYTRWTLALNVKGLPKDLMQAFAKEFSSVIMNAEDIDFAHPVTQSALAELIDRDDPSEKRVRKLLAQAQRAALIGAVKFAEALPVTFFLTDVEFHFDWDNKAFYCHKPVGLIGIAGHSFNKKVNAKIEYAQGIVLPNKSRMPDTLRIYLELDDNNWIYFELMDVYVRTIASYDEYNEIVADQVKKSQGKEPDKDKPQLLFMECTPEIKDQYIQRFSQYILKKR